MDHMRCTFHAPIAIYLSRPRVLNDERGDTSRSGESQKGPGGDLTSETTPSLYSTVRRFASGRSYVSNQQMKTDLPNNLLVSDFAYVVV